VGRADFVVLFFTEGRATFETVLRVAEERVFATALEPLLALAVLTFELLPLTGFLAFADLLDLRDLDALLRRALELLSTPFQPTARSARKAAGIAKTPSGLSMTAIAAASAKSARTSEITFAGRRARAT